MNGATSEWEYRSGNLTTIPSESSISIRPSAGVPREVDGLLNSTGTKAAAPCSPEDDFCLALRSQLLRQDRLIPTFWENSHCVKRLE